MVFLASGFASWPVFGTRLELAYATIFTQVAGLLEVVVMFPWLGGRLIVVGSQFAGKGFLSSRGRIFRGGGGVFHDALNVCHPGSVAPRILWIPGQKMRCTLAHSPLYFDNLSSTFCVMRITAASPPISPCAQSVVAAVKTVPPRV